MLQNVFKIVYVIQDYLIIFYQQLISTSQCYNSFNHFYSDLHIYEQCQLQVAVINTAGKRQWMLQATAILTNFNWMSDDNISVPENSMHIYWITEWTIS